MPHRELICIWLPNWSLQRLRADDALMAAANTNSIDNEDLEANHIEHDNADNELQSHSIRPPIVIYRDAGQHGCRVVTFCEQAAEYGVTSNMPLAEASALLPYPIDESNVESHDDAADSVAPTSRSGESFAGPRFELADVKRDRAALQTLAHFCQQYTPLFGVEEAENSESLFLDVTGCTHLFGNQQSLVEQIANDFQAAGYVARVAMAKTFGAAWAVAHCLDLPNRSRSSNITSISAFSYVLEPAQTESVLSPLPIASLRVANQTVQKLAEFDVLNIRQLSELPRTSLPSRFGKEILLRLDQALGERPEVLTFEKPPEPVQEKWHSEYATDDHRVLLKVLDELIERICNRLGSRHQGTHELQIWVNLGAGLMSEKAHVSLAKNAPPNSSKSQRSVFEFAVRLTEPTSSAKHLSDLISLQLERESLKKQNAYTRQRGKKRIPKAFDAEFSEVVVHAQSIAVLARRPRDLFGGLLNRDNEKELQTLLDRLSNRLGAEAVVKANVVDDPQPELAFEWTPFIASVNSGRATTRSANKHNETSPPKSEANNHDHLALSRPVSLYAAPIPIEVQLRAESLELLKFRCRQQVFQVTTSEGPERIQTGWWRPEAIRRDYFRVDTREQQRFWLYRCGATKRWFLHGIFD